MDSWGVLRELWWCILFKVTHGQNVWEKGVMVTVSYFEIGWMGLMEIFNIRIWNLNALDEFVVVL